jgi:hypothetical protein
MAAKMQTRLRTVNVYNGWKAAVSSAQTIGDCEPKGGDKQGDLQSRP